MNVKARTCESNLNFFVKKTQRLTLWADKMDEAAPSKAVLEKEREERTRERRARIEAKIEAQKAGGEVLLFVLRLVVSSTQSHRDARQMSQ
jgi:hypothetical protein